jgi:Leucine Rich repeat
MRLPVHVRTSVRALMVLVLFVGAGMGWIVHRARVQRDAVAAIVRVGGTVYYDWEVKYVPGAVVSYQPIPNAKPPWPKWLVDRLGPDYFGDVKMVRLGWAATDPVDADMIHVEKLTALEALGLRGHGITDAGLTHLSGLVKMRYLDLNFTRVTSVGLAHLRRMARLDTLYLLQTPVDDLSPIHHLTGLKRLDLASTRITDAGLAGVEGLSELTNLDLTLTPVTDACLDRVRALKKLRSLKLNATRVSNDAIAELQRERPSLKIVARNRPGRVPGPLLEALLYGILPTPPKPVAARKRSTSR